MQSNKVTFSSSDIYHILEQEITSLVLAPGQAISEIETSKRFGVSRTPTRDVFKRLEYNKLVKIIPQKGTIVTPISLERITEYMFIREKVELGVIEELMITISPCQWAKLQLILMKQEKLLKDESILLHSKPQRFFELDNEFHCTLFKLSMKENLWTIFISLLPDYQRFRGVIDNVSTLESLFVLHGQHKQILEFIEIKDFTSLKAIYKDHIYHGMEKIPSVLMKKQDYFID